MDPIKIDLTRDSLYDLSEFIKMCDPIIHTESDDTEVLPYSELQDLCKITSTNKQKD